MMKSTYQNEVRRKRSIERLEALSNAHCSAASSANAPGSSARRGCRSVVAKVEGEFCISQIPWHFFAWSFVKLGAEPLIELEVGEMQARVTRHECDLAESYPRIPVGIEIDAGELHLPGDGFRDADHFFEIVWPRALDRRLSVGDGKALP